MLTEILDVNGGLCDCLSYRWGGVGGEMVSVSVLHSVVCGYANMLSFVFGNSGRQ